MSRDLASELGLTVRINRRAKRISLKINATGQAVLVLPHERFRADGLQFAKAKQHWLSRQREALPTQIPIAPGSTIPYRGNPLVVMHDATSAEPVRIVDSGIIVGGREVSAPRLLLAWLRAEARRELTSVVGECCTALAIDEPAITLRDPKTRWGSCSARKTMSFSWRLILAPPHVLTYVAAHESAHLLELNHSNRFWTLVERLHPDYRRAEAWLKAHGRELHRYG